MNTKKVSKKRNKTSQRQKNVTLNISNSTNSSWKNLLPHLLFLIFSFILYGQTLSFGYVLDDEIVVTKNSFVQSGIKGLSDIFGNDSFLGYLQSQDQLYLLEGGRYRPISLATFALEISIFGKNQPQLSHLINILLYSLNISLLFIVLRKLFVNKSDFTSKTLPIIASLFFLIHPVHSEVVANIKGRDEILSFIFSLIAFYYTIIYLDKPNKKYLVFAFCSLLLALMSKESAVAFLLLIPIGLYSFKNLTFKNATKISAALVLAFLAFILIRYFALGYFIDHGYESTDLMNNPFLGMSLNEKYATIALALGWYLKLLVLPFPLTHDYYPYHVPIVSWDNQYVLLSLLFHSVLILWLIYKWKSKNIFHFSGVLYILSIAIVSNLFFTIGTFMNERFLYVPSLAFCLFFPAIVYRILSKTNLNIKKPLVITLSISATVAVIFFFITINRVPVWENSLSLNTAGIKVSSNSARANCFYAVSLYEERYLKSKDLGSVKTLVDSMEYYIDKSLSIYPDYKSALHMKPGISAAKYQIDKNANKLLSDFELVLKKIPENTILQDFVPKYLRYLYGFEPEKTTAFCYRIGDDYFLKQRKDAKNALLYLSVIKELNPNDPNINLVLTKLNQ